MSPPTRISNPDYLKARIERLIATRNERDRQAAALDTLAADTWKRYPDGAASMEATDERMKAHDWSRRAKMLRKTNRSTTKRIEKLSHKLSELQTIPLPGVLPDGSVAGI